MALSQDRWFIFFDWSAKFGVDEHGKQSHIIQMNTTSNVPKNFEKQFWQTFRQIAANPVGRVLLYRLLIEIRRVNNYRNECEENGNLRESTTNKKCLSIEINPANECKFKIVPQKSKAEISFNSAKITTFVLGVNNNFLSTKEKDRGADVGLFHEMLHWFHYLRKHQRVLDNKSGNPRDFKYVLRCYYGNQTELCVWGLICNVEEIATILGSPNYSNQEHLDLMCNNAFLPNQNGRRSLIEISQNQYIPKADKFLNGDDLSENVYRASKRLPMCFGHVNISINNFCILMHPHRFKLAHRVAFYCYYEITGNILEDWNYAIGEAISR